MDKKQKKLFTLVFVFDDDNEKLLLGLKKRGFGTGLINGFGGKVEANETIENAAIRELHEECGLIVKTKTLETITETECHHYGLQFAGINYFDFLDHPIVFEVHVFKISLSNVDGVVTESDEMKPQWYRYDDIPFDQMWPDDRHWFPSLFKKDVTFTGRHVFERIDSYNLIETNTEEEKCA